MSFLSPRTLDRLMWGAIVAFVAMFFAYQAFMFISTPKATDTAVVFIAPNSTLSGIAQTLVEAKVLPSSWRFKLWARIKRKTRVLQPGEYRFDIPSSPEKALEVLSLGKVVLHKITFPEGLSVKEVGRMMVAQKWMDEATFRGITQSEQRVLEWNLPGPTFEGYLFPDTYFFSKTDSPEKILKTLTNRFQKALTPQDTARAKHMGFTLREWITLASIIEKESSDPSEHPIISSVFHNRLRRGMRLQSDPTVIYGIQDFDGNLTKKHLQTRTPYNTYKIRGLPPGPIANPGASAISAAVNPAETEYLYFVAKRDGTHAFSKTYEQHQKNVWQYQLKRRSARR